MNEPVAAADDDCGHGEEHRNEERKEYDDLATLISHEAGDPCLLMDIATRQQFRHALLVARGAWWFAPRS